MLLGYNTNGLAHHDVLDAVELLASIGYRSVALTIDHGTLNPYGTVVQQQFDHVRDLLRAHGMRSTVETGARYLLEPNTKHEPTLMNADPQRRKRRLEFLRHAVDVAVQLESDCVSLWSGVVREKISDDEAFDRLIPGLREVLDYAGEHGMVLGFEPEPDMFIDTMSRFGQLCDRVNHPALKLTLDVGHLHYQGETPIPDVIRAWSSKLVNVHIEDMRAGIHEHLMFGEGEMDFPPIIDALREVGYQGGVHVELSRHSHDGPRAARRAFEFLAPLINRP